MGQVRQRRTCKTREERRGQSENRSLRNLQKNRARDPESLQRTSLIAQIRRKRANTAHKFIFDLTFRICIRLALSCLFRVYIIKS